MAQYKTGKAILCPLATAHEPEFVPFPVGEKAPVGSRVKLPDDTLVRIKPGLDLFEMPEGTQIEVEQPAEGRRHEAVFEEFPEGYATERWGGARKEEPYLRCSVCGATFPRWGIEEYLAAK